MWEVRGTTPSMPCICTACAITTPILYRIMLSSKHQGTCVFHMQETGLYLHWRIELGRGGNNWRTNPLTAEHAHWKLSSLCSCDVSVPKLHVYWKFSMSSRPMDSPELFLDVLVTRKVLDLSLTACVWVSCVTYSETPGQTLDMCVWLSHVP